MATTAAEPEAGPAGVILLTGVMAAGKSTVAKLVLRYRLATSVADTYTAAGFTAVLQDVIIGPVPSDVVQLIRTRPRYLVVLDPSPRRRDRWRA